MPDGRVEIYRYVDDESSGDGVRLSANKKKTWCMHSGKVTKRISVEEAAAIAKDLDLVSVVSDVLEQLVAKIVASSNNEPGQEDSTHTLAEDKGGDDIPANADEDDTNNMRVAQDEGIESQRTPRVDIRTNNNNIAEEEVPQLLSKNLGGRRKSTYLVGCLLSWWQWLLAWECRLERKAANLQKIPRQ